MSDEVVKKERRREISLPWDGVARLMCLQADEVLSLAEMARRLGVDHRQVLRWRDNGMPLKSADRVSGLLAAHPVEIWGADYFIGIEVDVDDEDLVAA